MQTIMPRKNDLFVDTSGWAYYVDRQDPLHPGILTLVQGVITRRRRLVTTNYIISELVALLSSRRHLPRRQVITAVNNIKKEVVVEIVYIERSFDNEAWKLLEAHPDKEWSLVDATSFVVMQHLGMTQALTTDHHFAQAGFTQLP
jgi:predicted nucleic acid-binding protein